MMPVLAAIVSPAGRPVAENVSGLCPLAGIENRNGDDGRAPKVNGACSVGAAGGAVIEMVIVVCACAAPPQQRDGDAPMSLPRSPSARVIAFGTSIVHPAGKCRASHASSLAQKKKDDVVTVSICVNRNAGVLWIPRDDNAPPGPGCFKWGLFVITRPRAAPARLARPITDRAWRRRSLEVLRRRRSSRGAGRGPEPPREWATRLRQLIDAIAPAGGGPDVVDADERLLRQRRDAHRSAQLSLGRHEAARTARSPAGVFPVHARGLGTLRALRAAAAAAPAGNGFFAVVPSRHRYYLPEASPGWTFGWIGIYHPYLSAGSRSRSRRPGPCCRRRRAAR